MTTVAAVGGRRQRRRRFWTLERKEEILGYIWISPWWIGFLAFTIYPMVASMWYSFTSFRSILSPGEYVGLANYVRAFMRDPLVWPSLGRTAYYTFAAVPLGLAGSLLGAIILNQKLAGVAAWRTVYFLPSLVPSVALAYVWAWILNSKYGLLNQVLLMVGVQGPAWLLHPEWAIPALLLMTVWGSVGGSSMLIFLASLQSISPELHEAAELDGAGRWKRLWHVTIPMLSPAILFNGIMGIIGTFQSWMYSYLVTDGGPHYATWFFGLHIYRQAFEYNEMAYACALSWIMFAIILAFIVLNFKISGRWVFMATEGSQ
jgi:multiple sugar transport system permease protein